MIDYVYPEEKTALHELVQNKEFQAVLKMFEKVYSDATEFAQLRGRNYKITSVTEPRIYYLYRHAAKRLELTADVPVYIELSDRFVPRICGTDGTCAIVISNTCLEKLTDLELTAMFGSVLSHIKYGHVKYLNLGGLLDEVLINIPFIGGPSATMIKALFAEWGKYAEFTADRGAAIAAGEAQAAVSYLSKCMGASFVVHHSQDKTALYSVKKMSKAERLAFQILVEDIPVPFGNLRLEELRTWLCSDTCRRHYQSLYQGGMGERAAWSGGGQNRAEAGKHMYQNAIQLLPGERERAMILLHAAAVCGLVQAQDYLARCYINGAYGIEKNDLAGIDWLKKAARKQCRESLFTLGSLMLKGAGTILPKNDKLGYQLIQLSAAKGHIQAQKWLENKKRVDGIEV